jgi:hypothetical protein
MTITQHVEATACPLSSGSIIDHSGNKFCPDNDVADRSKQVGDFSKENTGRVLEVFAEDEEPDISNNEIQAARTACANAKRAVLHALATYTIATGQITKKQNEEESKQTNSREAQIKAKIKAKMKASREEEEGDDEGTMTAGHERVLRVAQNVGVEFNTVKTLVEHEEPVRITDANL